jgi:hypothetical protein
MITMRLARVGLVAASLMASLSPGGAQAQEEGELVKNFLGALGVIDEEKPAIDYRERPALVLPPRLDLPEPVAPGSAQARNPQWPADPDVVSRRRQEAEAQLPAGTDEKSRITRGHGRLSVEEIRAGRVAGASLPNEPVKRSDRSWIPPDVLRAQHQMHRTTAAANEGPRRSLTEPPAAYRQSATGQPIKRSFEAPVRENSADPKSYIREQALRQQQR